MNKFKVSLVLITFLCSVPVAGMAMSHEGHDEHKGMDKSMHDGMKHDMHGDMDHGAMSDMQMIGQCEREGINAMAHIKAYGADAVASMKKMGMNGTHHLMLFFQKAGDKDMLTDGMAAVKIKGPDGKTSEPIKLMAMGQGFGADVALPAKGDYDIEVGTKLKDGKKRQFEFFYSNP